MEHEYQPVENAFREGTITSASDEDLSKHLLALANKPIDNDRIKHRDIIRGITINHMLLQHHIDRLNSQNSKTQRWFMVFAVISAIGAVAPYLMPPATPQVQVVVAQPAQPQQPSAPTQAQPQTSGQATKKSP
ncbi:MAG: hypothetical protein AB1469_03860 [Pseudomonadota bacterium]